VTPGAVSPHFLGKFHSLTKSERPLPELHLSLA
jgi:hypothetical protein